MQILLTCIFAFAIVIIPLIVLNVFIANRFYDAAKAKGYTDKCYFWLSFWLPIVGYLLVIALPDRKNG